MGGRFSTKGGQIALGGVLAAGALVMLWLAGVAPSGQLGLTAVGGLFPMAATLAAGRAAGYLCWGAAGLLGLILLPDKGTALLFLVFLGVYPVAKGGIESLRRLPLEWALKLIFFNLALTLCWFGLKALFLPFLPSALTAAWMVYAAGNVAFVIYDIGFSKLIAFYVARVDKVLRKAS